MPAISIFPSNETLYGEARQNEIDNHSGYVSKKAFEVNAGLFTALALVTVAVRLHLRIKYMRRIMLDDYILLFGTACLVASMATLYWQYPQIYLFQAMKKDPTRIVAEPDDIPELLKLIEKICIFMSINWTAIFAVKFSFLAYFSALIRNTSSRLKTYFWVVVGFTAATWGYLTSSTFIICPYFGMEAVVKCSEQDHAMDWSNLITTTALDIVTDLLVISFPLIILYQARMSRQQKVVLGATLSLSVAMIVVAAMRLVGSLLVKGIVVDQEWEFLWQQLEASVAVMMGSLTAFRGAFNRGDGTGRPAASSETSAPREWWKWGSGTRRSGQQCDEGAGSGSGTGSEK